MQPPFAGDRGPDLVALVRQGRDALARHRVRAAQVFVGLLAVAVIGAVLLPARYESEAQLMVKIGRESVTLDPTATVGQTLSIYDSRETEVNTILEIMASRAVLDDVVASLGPPTILDRAPATSAGSKPIDPKVREQAIEALRRTTSVERGKKSNIVTVRARSYSPEVAQRIARAMLEAFRTRYLAANRTAGSYEFFVEQERLTGDGLADAMRELNTVRNGLALGTVEGERVRIEGRLATLEEERSASAASLAAADARIASLETAIADLPERRVLQEVTGFAEDAGGRTHSQLYVLKLEEHDLLTRFQPTHPDVLSLRERIDEAERTLEAESARNTQTTTSPDPSRQQLELERLVELSNAASLRARAGELDEQHAAAIERLRRLNESEARLVSLRTTVDQLQADHREYAGKLEQARIDQALALDRISNVNVWQQPTFVDKAVPSNRRLVCLLGLFVATVGAAGTALGLEYLDRQRRVAEGPAVDPVAPPLGTRLAHAMKRP